MPPPFSSSLGSFGDPTSHSRLVNPLSVHPVSGAAAPVHSIGESRWRTELAENTRMYRGMAGLQGPRLALGGTQPSGNASAPSLNDLYMEKRTSSSTATPLRRAGPEATRLGFGSPIEITRHPDSRLAFRGTRGSVDSTSTSSVFSPAPGPSSHFASTRSQPSSTLVEGRGLGAHHVPGATSDVARRLRTAMTVGGNEGPKASFDYRIHALGSPAGLMHDATVQNRSSSGRQMSVFGKEADAVSTQLTPDVAQGVGLWAPTPRRGISSSSSGRASTAGGSVYRAMTAERLCLLLVGRAREVGWTLSDQPGDPLERAADLVEQVFRNIQAERRKNIDDDQSRGDESLNLAHLTASRPEGEYRQQEVVDGVGFAVRPLDTRGLNSQLGHGGMSATVVDRQDVAQQLADLSSTITALAQSRAGASEDEVRESVHAVVNDSPDCGATSAEDVLKRFQQAVIGIDPTLWHGKS